MLTEPTVSVHTALPLEVCANCGNAIGSNETPLIWQESAVVCSICHEQLQDQQMIFRAFGKRVPGMINAGFKM